MEDRENRRPGRERQSTVARERPAARGPRPPRRQSGRSSERESARVRRSPAQEVPAEEAPAERSAPARGTAQRQSRERTRAPERSRSETGRTRADTGRTRSDAGRSRAEPERSRSAKPARRKRKPRLRNTNFRIKFLTMLAVVAVLVLGLMIFFKIKHIEVVGNEYYTPEEIIDASGVALDDNLLSLSKATASARIRAALPYISEIQIQKKLPGTVVITVSEFEVSYGIQDEAGSWWLINREGRILEQTDAQAVKSHMLIKGMTITPPAIGDLIKPAAADGADLSEIAAKRNAALTVLPLLEKTPFAKELVSVDVATSYDIIRWYGTQFESKLGNTENIAYKLQYLQGVLENLGKEKSGTIDLSFTEDNSAHCLPFG